MCAGAKKISPDIQSRDFSFAKVFNAGFVTRQSFFNQLHDECKFKMPEYDIGKLERQWRDLQKAFDERIGLHSSLALKHAIGAMNRDFEGTQHTALADAANTAAIFAMLQDDEEFFLVM